tara:strand:- start:295 stop:537 length:243 start_codon:yes stop_codon:yes gene_type:complete
VVAVVELVFQLSDHQLMLQESLEVLVVEQLLLIMVDPVVQTLREELEILPQLVHHKEIMEAQQILIHLVEMVLEEVVLEL